MLEESIVLVQIIFIDVIMAADNAIIIAMIAANFAPKHRKQIIMYGVFAAFIFRIIFALSATYLFEFAIIKIVGGALLVWIVNDLRQDLFGKKKKIKSVSHLHNVLKKDLDFIKINYGNFLLFNQNLPHGNIVNKTSETRITLNCRFKGLFTPYAQKKLGSFFSPITIKPASKVGLEYKFPGE